VISFFLLCCKKEKEIRMEEEMKWITIWVLANTVMLTLSLTYFYLNHELSIYWVWTGSLYLSSTTLPYLVWKYNQLKFVEKSNIVIQILKD